MDPDVRTALAELNRAFYDKFAGEFAHTRQSWPPGFMAILPYLATRFNVLDLGCGNGRLLLFLAGADWRGRYVGVDGSAGLLEIARRGARQLPGIEAHFVAADLLDPMWPAQVAGAASDAIAVLAVPQHIPGAEARASFLRSAAGLLAQDGLLVLSTWQFLTAPRLRNHILPWSLAGLTDADVEPGDYLLSWGQGAQGRRYCAFIDEASLLRLAGQAGLEAVATLYADGHEKNLNLYGVFRPATR